MRELGLKALHAGGARVYSAAAAFALLAITARWLGPDGRGIVAGTITWTTMLALVGYLSLGQAAMFRAGQRRDDAWLGPVLTALLVFLGIATVVLWVFVAVIYVASGGAAFHDVPAITMVVGFAIVPFLLWEQYGSSLLMARDRLDIYNRAQVAGKSAALAALLVFLTIGLGVKGALLALAIGQAVVAGVGVRYLIRDAGGLPGFDANVLRWLVRWGAKLHPATIGAFLVFGVDALVVYLYEGSAVMAFYQLGAQLVFFMWLVPQVVSMALLTRVARQRPHQLWGDQRRLLVSVTAVMSVAALAAVALAPVAIPFMFGERFEDAVGLFQVLALALPGLTVAMLMSAQWIARGMFATASLVTVGCGVVNLGLVLALVPAHGADGAAVATAIACTLLVVPNAIFALQCEREYRAAAESPGPHPRELRSGLAPVD